MKTANANAPAQAQTGACRILSNERPPSRTVEGEVMNGTPQGTSFQGRPVLVLAGGCEYMISLASNLFPRRVSLGATPGARPQSTADDAVL
jgi:hypothetical protein